MSDDSYEIIVNRFTEETAKDFRKKMRYRTMKDPSSPIEVYIDSYGGYVDSLNHMLATIRQTPNPIVTVCVGKAMSAGAVLLAAGDHRFCDHDARIMIHEMSGGVTGHNDDIQTDAKESERLNRQIMDFLAMRCKKSYNEIKKLMKDTDSRDLYLSAEDALEFGLVDHIGIPNITPIVMYSIQPTPKKEYSDPETDTQEALDLLESFTQPKKKTRRTAKKKAPVKKATKITRRRNN